MFGMNQITSKPHEAYTHTYIVFLTVMGNIYIYTYLNYLPNADSITQDTRSVRRT